MARLLAIAVFLFSVQVILGTPVEVVYTDEGCGCGKTYSYDVKVPYVPKVKEKFRDFVYRVEFPEKETCDTYSYDFKAQAPRIIKEEIKLKDYLTKVDRYAVPAPDCVEKETYKEEPCYAARKPCGGCGQCSSCTST